MPRSGDEYALPAGTAAVSGTTANSTHVNERFADLAEEQNLARPVSKGGTGATSAAAALVNLGLNATAAELNILDGATVTTAELNVLDGIPGTLTATEIGYLDGVTSAIQTQLNGKQATITTLPLANGGTGAALVDPNADRLLFWDDSAGAMAFLTAGTGLAISGTTLTASSAGWERVETVYDSAVDGAQTTLETSDFEDGYSYRLVGLYLSGSGTAGMGAEFFRQTSAAYSSVTTIGGSTSLATNFTYTLDRPMEAEFYHHWWGSVGVGFATTPANSQTVIASSPLAITHATAQKISKIRITRPSQNFTAGKLYLERQKVS